MATPVVDFRLADPYIPSLYQISSVKIAETLLNGFDAEALGSIFSKFKPGTSSFNESILKSCKAKEKLLLIPAHLRHDVLIVVMSMHNDIYFWRLSIDFPKLNSEDLVFYWRWDGKIDKLKSAQHFALNANINIKARFQLACVLGLEKSILSLWAEMDASDKTEYLKDVDSFTYFWAAWLNGGCRIPWIQAMKDHFHYETFTKLPYRHTFFPLLKPEERKRYLVSFLATSPDDIRLCLYLLTQEEKMFVLNECAIIFLIVHLDWPLQSFFIEKAVKLVHLLDEYFYQELLKLIWTYHNRLIRKDFDYYHLFQALWNIGPQHWREYAEKDPYVKNALDACLNETRHKRKETESSGTNCRKCMRSGEEK